LPSKPCPYSLISKQKLAGFSIIDISILSVFKKIIIPDPQIKPPVGYCHRLPINEGLETKGTRHD